MLKTWLLDCATARELGLDDHRPCRSAASPRRRRPAPTNLHLEPGTLTPDELIADIEDGFYVTDLIGIGRQHGDRRLQPRRLRLLDRERRAAPIR